jgi:hypothetical protein
MFCPSCGSENPEGAKFCNGCGASLLRACPAARATARAPSSAANAERLFKGAAGLFQELATPFPLAVTRLEHAEWLTAQARADETQPLLAEAREIFERLEAKPWLERLARTSPTGRETEAVASG